MVYDEQDLNSLAETKQNVLSMLKGKCPLCGTENNIGLSKVTRKTGYKYIIRCNHCGYGKDIVKYLSESCPNEPFREVVINGRETNLVVDEEESNQRVLSLIVHKKPLCFKDLLEDIRKGNHLKSCENSIFKLLSENEQIMSDVQNIGIRKKFILIIFEDDCVVSVEDICKVLDIPYYWVMQFQNNIFLIHIGKNNEIVKRMYGNSTYSRMKNYLKE